MINSKIIIEKAILIITAHLFAIISFGQQPAGQGDACWELIFSDEFSGSVLNAVWEPSWYAGDNISPPISINEDGCYDPSQVSVSNGTLKLTAVNTSDTNCRKRDESLAPYKSGMINSRNSFSFAYGYIEARIYLDGASGELHNWPAFWTNGYHSPSWPEMGEIDIMEGLSAGQPCWHYHYNDSVGTHQGPGGCVSWANPEGWHIFAVHWKPGTLTYYYDGTEVGTWADGIVSDTHYIITNYGINENFGVHVSSTMEVDYIRVWKKNDSLDLSIDAEPTSAGNCEGKAWVVAGGGTAPYTYLWNDSLNQTADTASDLCAGNYRVTVADAFDCTDTISVNVDQLTGMRKFTGNAGNIRAYPNPTNGLLTVEIQDPGKVAVIQVYDLMGQKRMTLHCAENPSPQYQLNLNGLPEGIYLLQALDDNIRIVIR